MRAKSSTCLIRLGLVLLFCALQWVNAEGEEEVDLSRLRVKELKRMLDERGVTCEGCVEKEHVLSKVKESLHLPVLSEEELQARAAAKQPPKPEGGKGGRSGEGPQGAGAWSGGGRDYSKDMEMQEILKKLNLGDRVKMFRPEDFMKYADDLDTHKETYEREEKRKSDEL